MATDKYKIHSRAICYYVGGLVTEQAQQTHCTDLFLLHSQMLGKFKYCSSEGCQFVSTFLPRHCTEAPGDKSKIKYNQLKNSAPHLISDFIPIIETTSDDHLLVQVSSSETSQHPGKNLLCTEQHF